MDATGEHIVLGAGESGVSAARLARREGLQVFVSDAGAGNPRYLAELAAEGIAYETGGHGRERILAAAEVIKSPGIPDSVPLVRELRERGVPVISEIEFAARYLPAGATVIGITGSNGKTTTTLLTHHLLRTAGRDALAGGNLGESLARLLVDRPAAEVYVLELSSFQLDGTVDFRPHIAAVLNITPDHLDRYDDQFDRYADSKMRIGKNQAPKDLFLTLRHSDTIAPALCRNKIDAETILLDVNSQIEGMNVKIGGHSFGLNDTELRGRHNAANALFAARIALLLDVTPNRVQQGLESFRPAAHRMEFIPTPDGRRWINDSKATNVNSAYYALQSMDTPTVWIAGGTDKGNDYAPLYAVIDCVHTLICLGVDNEKLKGAFTDRIDCVLECQHMARAVEMADHRAAEGDTVLLSPACASFDLFKNYLDRGDRFRTAVRQITHA